MTWWKIVFKKETLGLYYCCYPRFANPSHSHVYPTCSAWCHDDDMAPLPVTTCLWRPGDGDGGYPSLWRRQHGDLASYLECPGWSCNGIKPLWWGWWFTRFRGWWWSFQSPYYCFSRGSCGHATCPHCSQYRFSQDWLSRWYPWLQSAWGWRHRSPSRKGIWIQAWSFLETSSVIFFLCSKKETGYMCCADVSVICCAMSLCLFYSCFIY